MIVGTNRSATQQHGELERGGAEARTGGVRVGWMQGM